MGTIYYREPAAKPAVLFVMERGENVKAYSFRSNMSFGRNTVSRAYDIGVASRIVSGDKGRHGEFSVIDGKFYYTDNNSYNGSFVNDKYINDATVEIKNGDTIRIDSEEHNDADPVLILFSTSFGTAFDGRTQWRRKSLEKGKNTIGRYKENDICLNDFFVSGSHAVIDYNGRCYTVTDCGSTNGTKVNNTFIKKGEIAELKNFDVIKMADTSFIYFGNEVIFNIADEYIPHCLTVDIDDAGVRNRVNKSWFAYKYKMILKDIRIKLKTGDFVLVLGGAGTGKTTLINSLMGIIRANGKITFDGTDLYSDSKLLRSKIGLVPQFSTTRQSDTVYNTIMDSALVRLSGREYSKAEVVRRVDEIIEMLGLTALKDNQISSLSGGQKKKVEVAMQAIGNQSVFILDEPDSGMDSANGEDLMRSLNTLKEKGKIVAVITHSPDNGKKYFTKVLVLARNRDNVAQVAFWGNCEDAFDFFGAKSYREIIKAVADASDAEKYIEKYKEQQI